MKKLSPQQFQKLHEARKKEWKALFPWFVSQMGMLLFFGLAMVELIDKTLSQGILLLSTVFYIVIGTLLFFVGLWTVHKAKKSGDLPSDYRYTNLFFKKYDHQKNL
ncbi:hypothetical protein GCM10011571_33530 [Marinithermofilum abyssi]|uniref:Uncharacterized protein n=1 Tax=Marinithermofilum abyssi TaxID=1571185 RepID=A0A8J2VLU3_9BACL|nr:hypothetical protein [Marinithermofilum abyssi]GGE28709.1 hypothetical protein GCM10011571_33530 [Marinithermofilum abyssi]